MDEQCRQKEKAKCVCERGGRERERERERERMVVADRKSKQVPWAPDIFKISIQSNCES